MDKIQILQDKVLINGNKINSRKFFSKLEKNLYGANNNVIEKENSNSIVSFNELKIRYEGHEYDVEIGQFEGRENYEKRLSLLAKLSEVLKGNKADFSNLSLKEQKYCFKVLRKTKNKEREYLHNLGIDLLYALKQLFTEEGFYALVAPPFLGFIFMLVSCFIAPKVLLYWDKMIVGLAIGGVVSKLSFEVVTARYQTYQVDKSCIMRINEIKEELKEQLTKEKAVIKEEVIEPIKEEEKTKEKSEINDCLKELMTSLDETESIELEFKKTIVEHRGLIYLYRKKIIDKTGKSDAEILKEYPFFNEALKDVKIDIELAKMKDKEALFKQIRKELNKIRNDQLVIEQTVLQEQPSVKTL